MNHYSDLEALHRMKRKIVEARKKVELDKEQKGISTKFEGPSKRSQSQLQCLNPILSNSHGLLHLKARD